MARERARHSRSRTKLCATANLLDEKQMCWAKMLRSAEFRDQRFPSRQRQTVDTVENHRVDRKRNHREHQQDAAGNPNLSVKPRDPEGCNANAHDNDLHSEADEHCGLSGALAAE